MLQSVDFFQSLYGTAINGFSLTLFPDSHKVIYRFLRLLATYGCSVPKPSPESIVTVDVEAGFSVLLLGGKEESQDC